MKKTIVKLLLEVILCFAVLTACGIKQENKADASAENNDKVITVAANGSFFFIIYMDDKGI